jgi:hypothetical protein
MCRGNIWAEDEIARVETFIALLMRIRAPAFESLSFYDLTTGRGHVSGLLAKLPQRKGGLLFPAVAASARKMRHTSQCPGGLSLSALSSSPDCSRAAAFVPQQQQAWNRSTRR